MAAAVIARAGMRDSAVAVIRRTSSEQARHPGTVWQPQIEAYVWLLLGDRDTALRLLSRYVHELPRVRQHVASSPWYRDLHSDPRYQELIRGQ